MRLVDTGNHVAAWGARLARVEVVSAYPITPQTQVIEEISRFIDEGEMDCEYIPVESEHSAMAAMIGASLPAYLISGLSPGLLTALQYGQRTAEIPNVILTTQFSSVAGIKFNDLAARHLGVDLLAPRD